MKAFFKEHFVMIAGLALPLILSLIFFLSANVQISNVPPPEYSVVFALNYIPHHQAYPYKISAKSGQLEFRYIPPKEDQNRHWAEPQLYLFNPKTNHVSALELPDYDEDQRGTYTFSELENTQMSHRAQSPDGYLFQSHYRGGGNLMTELFGSGRHRGRYRYMLIKDGHQVPIDMYNLPSTSGYPYLYSAAYFIGWVVDE